MSRGRLHAGPTPDESEVSPPSSGAQAPRTCAPAVHLAAAPTSASARSTTTSRRRGCRQNRGFDSPPCGRAQLRAASAGFCPPKTQRRASKPDSTMATAHRPQGVSVYGLKPMHVHVYNPSYHSSHKAKSAYGPPSAPERRGCKSRVPLLLRDDDSGQIDHMAAEPTHGPHHPCSSSSWLGARGPFLAIANVLLDGGSTVYLP